MYIKSDACASYVVVDSCFMQIWPILMQCRTWNLITTHHHHQTLLFIVFMAFIAFIDFIIIMAWRVQKFGVYNRYNNPALILSISITRLELL